MNEIKQDGILAGALLALRIALDITEGYGIGESPFSNSGEYFTNDAFEVHAYEWDDREDRPPNFKWRDIEINWYKHYRRGATVNREVTLLEIEEMLSECLGKLYIDYGNRPKGKQ